MSLEQTLCDTCRWLDRDDVSFECWCVMGYLEIDPVSCPDYESDDYESEMVPVPA